MKLYMDVCSYNRPFDDLSQDRVYFEAEAVLSILERCKNGEWVLATSAIVEIENSRQKDLERLEKVQMLYQSAQEYYELTESAKSRAIYFQQNGVKLFDSYHLAVSEENRVDVLLTTDDRFLKAAKRMKLNIKIETPIKWLIEEENK